MVAAKKNAVSKSYNANEKERIEELTTNNASRIQ